MNHLFPNVYLKTKLNRRVLKILSVLCRPPLVKQAYLQKFISVIDDLLYKTVKLFSFSTEPLNKNLNSATFTVANA